MSLKNNPKLFFLEEYRKDYPEIIQKIEFSEEKFQQQIDRFADENPKLSIGIIGQVKAGKSTFLNSLLFNGKNLLPTAATPKTANLTRIRYAEKPSFTAIFYSEDQWKSIVEKANSNQDHLMEVKAAKEMVESVKKSGANVEKLLAEHKKVIHANNIDDLMKELNTYIGGDGRLTALVSETELAINIKELEGIEIVDTPGMNDPVVSRVLQTKKYIGNCDVVFFLSRASQFLDESDQNLLSEQLPDGGVKKLILEGSQFDTAVLEDGIERNDFQSCIQSLNTGLTEHAQKIFERLSQNHIKNADYYQQDLEAKENNDNQIGQEAANSKEIDYLNSQKEKELKIADLLKNSATPIFSSTHAYSIVSYLKNNVEVEKWDKGIKNTYDNLNSLADDYWEQKLSLADFEQLSNFSPLQEELTQAKANKEKILQEKKENLEKNINIERNKNLNDLKELVDSKLYVLKNNDLDSLNKQIKQEQELLNDISDILYAEIQELIEQAENKRDHILSSISDSASTAKKVDKSRKTRQIRHSRGNKDKAWYKPWTWGDDEYDVWYENVDYYIVRVPDVLRNLRNYADAASREINEFFNFIEPETFRTHLFKVLKERLETEDDENFNSTNLKNIIKESLMSLDDLPDLNVSFSREELEDKFGFSGDVEGDYYIEQIKEKASSETKRIRDVLVDKLESAINTIVEKLNDINENLKDKLQKDYKVKIDKLREDIDNKEISIGRCEELIAYLKKLIDYDLLNCQSDLDDIYYVLNAKINSLIKQIENKRDSILSSLLNRAAKAQKVNKNRKTRQIRHSRGNKDKAWYKPWTWDNDEYDVWYENVDYYIVRVPDVLRNLRNYADAASREINEFFNFIEPETFRTHLFKVLKERLETEDDENFNSTNLNNIIKESLMSLDDLPLINVSFSREELEDKFGFSGDVEGDYYIEQIKEKASSETKRIRDVLVDKLESAITTIVEKLNNVDENLKNNLQEVYKVKIN